MSNVITGNARSRLDTGCVPFFISLMLYVVFGYQAIITGSVMAPTEIVLLMAKSAITQVLNLFRYLKILISITAISGGLIPHGGLDSPVRLAKTLL
jgi:hypothetical protein